MPTSFCITCQKPKANLTCGICSEKLCKNCTYFLEENFFSFCKVVDEKLLLGRYCGTCYFKEVQPQIDNYENTMQKARDISIFYKNQAKETRRMSRLIPPLLVENCYDKDETVLRLAFYAAQANYNTLIDVELTSQKVKTGKYQHLIWAGTAVPLILDSQKLIRK